MLIKSSEILEFSGVRLDKFLASKISDSRSKIQVRINSGDILVNNRRVKTNYVLRDGDEVFIKDEIKLDMSLKHEDLNLNILYESASFLIVEKPFAMVTHPGDDGNYSSGTLVNGLLDKIEVLDFEDKMRPGIVHRLDKDTSGLLIVAKTRDAYDFYVNEFKNRNLKKKYKALLAGEINVPKALIDSPIGRDRLNRKKMAVLNENEGKEARTYFELIQYYHYNMRNFSLVDIDLLTGRTHQIRVHMSSIGFPVLGDQVYGSVSNNKYALENMGLKRQFLHAYRLEFVDFDLKEKRVCEIDLPDDLKEVLETLKNGIYKRR